LENRINYRKIQSAKQMYGNLIGINPMERKPFIASKSNLSIYNAGFAYKPRAFSAVYQICNFDSVKKQQIKEIELIKQRVAKYKIHLTMKTLVKAIIIPEGLPEEQARRLPEQGFRLLSNPFAKGKKKRPKTNAKAKTGGKRRPRK